MTNDPKKRTNSPTVAALVARIGITRRIERALDGLAPDDAIAILEDVHAHLLKIKPRILDDTIVAPKDVAP